MTRLDGSEWTAWSSHGFINRSYDEAGAPLKAACQVIRPQSPRTRRERLHDGSVPVCMTSRRVRARTARKRDVPERASAPAVLARAYHYRIAKFGSASGRVGSRGTGSRGGLGWAKSRLLLRFTISRTLVW